MKVVTEFSSFILEKALKAKAALEAEGKALEEILENLGGTFKLEGEKTKHLMNAMEATGGKTDGLRRVLVISLNEGESTPAKAVKIEESVYLPEILVTAKPAAQSAGGKGGRPGGRGGGRGEKKGGSPWGMSPEEKAAKTGKAPKA